MAGTRTASGAVDVVLDANGAPVQKAINDALKRVRDIEKVTQKIVQNAQAAAEAFTKGKGQQMESFSKMLGRLEGLERRLQTSARQPIARDDGDRLFAQRIRRVADFRQGIAAASNAAQAFQARLNTIDRKLVAFGNEGKVNKRLMSNRLGLENAEKDFKKIQREIEATDRLARRSGVTVSRSGVAAAETDLFRALKRGRVNITPQIANLRAQGDAYIAAVQAERARVQATTVAGSEPPGLFGAHGLKGVLMRTGAYGAAAAAIYGVVDAVTSGIRYTVEFEDRLAKISAIAGLTATQTAELGETISNVGSKSRFATLEIAEATTVLAQAGFSAEDIKVSLAGVANLASAAGVTFAEATDVITSAIGAFQLQASETGRITDVLSSALNNTKLNIQQVALGIQYAGATAYANKISFEELTAVMATMAQAGIRSGSTIGTGLRQFLVDLQTPTKKMVDEFTKLGLTMEDIDVKHLGLPEVLKRLSDAGFASANAYRTLETRAAAAYLVLKNNRDEINKQIIAQNQVGLAAEAAAKGQNSLAAQWQRFKNILNDNVANGLEPATAALKNFLQVYNDVNSNENLKEMKEELKTLDVMSDEYLELSLAIERTKREIKETAEVNAEHAAAMEEAKTEVNRTTEAFNGQNITIDSVNEAIRKTILRKSQLKDGSVELAAETASLTGRFAGLAAELYGTAASYDNLVAAMQRYRTQAIAQGALRAQERSMALGSLAIRQDRQGVQHGAAFMRGGGVNMLPAKERAAFFALGRNPRDSTAARVLYDYSNKKGTTLTPGMQQTLRNYAQSKSSAGVSANESQAMRMQADVYGHMGSEIGRRWMSELDSLSGASDAKIKDFIDRANQAAVGKTPSAQRALHEIATQASALFGSGTPPQGPESAAKRDRSGEREARRKEREEDRRQMAIMRQRMKATEAQLKLDVDNIAQPGGASGMEGDNILVTARRRLTPDQFKKNLEKAEGSLQTWIEHRLDVMNAEIDSANMSGEEAELFRAEVQREIQAKTEETSKSIGEGIKAAMEAMVEAVMEIKERAEAAADHELNMIGAKLTALDRFGMRGRVPDYVRNFYQRREQSATDKRDRSQIGINNRAIGKLSGDADWWEQMLGIMESKGHNTEGVRKTIADLRFEIENLTRANEVLKASFNGESLLPDSFSRALDMAIEDFRDAQGLNLSFADQLKNEIPNALNTAYQATSTFFTDILTGTKSVKAAFADFVKSMINYLQQLVAQFIAKQIFKMLLGLVDPGAAAKMYHGGKVEGNFHGGHIKGAFRGEHIRDGVPGRDSTLRNLAKGEYVVRKAAVDSVGVDFMNRLNERGSQAVQPAVMPIPAPVTQEMAIYVVKEGHRPQMGPNDVLMVLQDDILKDGQTKKLIKLVAQGA